MRDNQESGTGDRTTDDRQTQAASESGKSFPTNADVGVIDDPGEALRAADELRTAGFDPEVLCSESHDDETTDRIRDVFSEHGGHFVNYYSDWTGETLIP